MRDKSIYLGATEFTRAVILGPYDQLLRLSPEEQADFNAFFKEFSQKCTRRLQSAMKFGVKIAAGSDMWFDYPGKTRGHGHGAGNRYDE